MIPEARHEVVATALRATFGVATPDEIRKLTAGLSSALVYRIVIRGRAYLLRIIENPNPQWEPTAHFAAMQAAAEVGIAPRVHYASVTDRLSITDFVEAQPYPADAAPLIGPMLRTLHALPPFAKTVNHFGVIDGFVAKAAPLPLATDELYERYAEIRAAYPEGADLAPCHNDLKSDNVLFDGKQFWFVDWEAAFNTNRYFDLATAGNFFMRDEDAYLTSYVGRQPTEQERARALAVRVICHVSYTSLFTILALRDGAIADDSPAPDFRAFHDQLIAGTADPRDAATKLRYAKTHLQEALRIVRSPRFVRALAHVA